jgi:predicted subunit of tRNA(5-methylaminomethyl-2-thiouridylate) methyltransferase
MPTDIEPIEGNWYESIEDGSRFFVVTIDEEEGIVEIQHDDGTPEEITIEAWHEADLEPIAPPDEVELFGDTADQDDETPDYSQTEDSDEDEWGEPLPEIEE